MDETEQLPADTQAEFDRMHADVVDQWYAEQQEWYSEMLQWQNEQRYYQMLRNGG